ncbi:hypothetical protein FOA52_011927 [Chlamydomonas sp. UWO 241]|nr:hypothetical protein FOA52_011927 [Chlamydomonas sp. UWO 241]
MASNMMMKQQAGRMVTAGRPMRTVPRLPAQAAGAAPRLPARAARRSAVLARAELPPALAKASAGMGMPTDDGVFGFTPFAEMWAGRWAMLGFVASICVEFVTGRGTLQQIGLPAPSDPVLTAICVLAGGATLVGTVKTALRVSGKKMSKSEIGRYKSFLGLNKEDDWKSEAAAMKLKGDFTTPGNNEAAIASSKAAGAPVDPFLSTNEIAEGGAASAQMKAEGTPDAVAAAAAARAAAATASRAADTMYFGESGEIAYARDIEISNGRWAMVGFLTAIVVEASTGNGILGQLVSYAKMSGLLGERSGF